MKGKTGTKIYMPANYEKSNKLITGKSNMTLSEQKTVAYALRKLRDEQVMRPEHRFTDEEMRMGIKEEMSPREFVKEVFKGKNATSIGKVLSTIATGLHSSTILLETEEENSDNWKTYSFIKTCEYKDGVFSITFHEEASSYLVNLQDHGSFTLLDYNVVSELDSSHAVRIYEYIEKEYRRQTARDKTLKKIEFYVDMVEFKTSIGVIDPDNNKVKELLNAYPAPSSARYDFKERIELMEKLVDIDRNMNTTTKLQRRQACKYNKFYEFRRNVLDVAKNQINSIDFYNLTFDYEPVCAPGGKRVVGIQFTIYDKKDYQTEKENYEQLELPIGEVASAIAGVNSAETVDTVGTVNSVETVDTVGTVNSVENADISRTANNVGTADIPQSEVVGAAYGQYTIEEISGLLESVGTAEYLKTYHKYPCTVNISDKNELTYLKDVVRTLIEEMFDLAVKQKTIQNMMYLSQYQYIRIVDNLLYVKRKIDRGMDIDNLEGYLTAAVKEDYAAAENISPKGIVKKDRKKAGSNFEGRKYDMDSLEEQLLKHRQEV